jgi:hypothetical protein
MLTSLLGQKVSIEAFAIFSCAFSKSKDMRLAEFIQLPIFEARWAALANAE